MKIKNSKHLNIFNVYKHLLLTPEMRNCKKKKKKLNINVTSTEISS